MFHSGSYLAHVLALVEVGRLEEVPVLQPEHLALVQELLDVLHLEKEGSGVVMQKWSCKI